MLMTGAMRKAMWEARFAGYERAVLRIHFPAHVIVQAVFRPRETGLSLLIHIIVCVYVCSVTVEHSSLPTVMWCDLLH